MGFAATHEPLRTAQVRCSPAHAPISDSSPSPLESQVATADPAPGHGILGGGVTSAGTPTQESPVPASGPNLPCPTIL